MPKPLYFYKVGEPRGFLSNFSLHPVTLRGKTLPTGEHGFHYLKALYFGDTEAQRRIELARTPFDAKEAGRLVRGFEEGKWVEVRFDFMLEVLRSKVERNSEVRAKLLETAGFELVEASKYDRVWGAGCYQDELERGVPPVGLNLLGKAWMLVREELLLEKYGAGEAEAVLVAKRVRVSEEGKEGEQEALGWRFL